MAIEKNVENVYGAKFNYHRISEVKLLNQDGEIQLRIVVDSYVDQNARLNGKKPVRTENIILHADFALAPFYALLKAKFQDYSDSEDVFEEIERLVQPAEMIQQTVDGRLISHVKEGEV